MNKYEICLVVSAQVEEEVRLQAVEKAKEYVGRYNGTVTKVDEWGKKRLAYEIQKMREGYYYFIKFEAQADAPKEIESHLRIMENVLRYLIVRDDEREVAIPEDKKEESEESTEE